MLRYTKVALFERFQEAWEDIKEKNFTPGTSDKDIYSQICDCIDETKIFIEKQLKKEICRGDYREFLELSLLFIGGRIPHTKRQKVIFHPPGAVHHARWMAKAMYALKILLFREHFTLSSQQLNGLKAFCVFVIRFYVKLWFRCSNAIKAPYRDLTFLKTIFNDSKDPKTSTEVVRKFCKHLWYLGEESIALAFFDDDVPVELKRKMVTKLNIEGEEIQPVDEEDDEDPSKRFVVNPKDVEEIVSKDLSFFVTHNTLIFFGRFDIDTNFLHHDPSVWHQREDFKHGKELLRHLKVVNDTAERGVKLMEEYNSILTRNETERQYIVEVVSEYRKTYYSYNKSVLVSQQPKSNR